MLASMRCASDKSTGRIETASIATLREPSAGTLIVVATRRNAANERPSIISSSVTTS